MTKSQKSKLMFTAWQFVKQTGITLSEALKKSWANFKLVQQMLKGIVNFRFTKINGEIREAWGTLQNVEEKIKGTKHRMANKTVQVYWDTEKESFRCFKKFNLI